MNYQGVTPNPGAALKPIKTNITDDALVEKRITGLLSQNNPYMQQAQTRGLQQANARGLLSSSMAVGAVEGQRIAAALPIATQDANLYGQAALQDSNYLQQGGLNNQSYQNQASIQDQSYGNTRGLNQQQFGFSTALNNQQNAFMTGQNDQMAALNQERDRYLHGNSMDLEAHRAQLTADSNEQLHNNSIETNAQTAMNNIIMDQSIPPNERDAMIENINFVAAGEIASVQLSENFVEPAGTTNTSNNASNQSSIRQLPNGMWMVTYSDGRAAMFPSRQAAEYNMR